MRIRCPECQFEREINSTAIPASASMATCPRCRKKFRFREPGETQPDAVPPLENESAPIANAAMGQQGDDDLPPGAVIPQLEQNTNESHAAAPIRESAREKASPEKNRAEGLSSEEKPSFRPALLQRPDMDEASAREVPWERIDLYGYVGGFYHTILRVLFRAPEFFTYIRSSNTPVRALTFYIIMGLWQIFTVNFWYAPFPAVDVTAPQAEAMVNGAMGQLSLPMTLLLSPFALLLNALVLSGLYHLMFRLAQPDRADYAVTLRVLCYSAAPYIVCLVPVVGHLVALPWFVACTFVGCKYALGLSWSRTTLALAPLFVLGLAMMQFAYSLMLRPMG